MSCWNGEMFPGGMNHSGCCVREDCSALCADSVISSELHASCLSHIDNIVTCLRQLLGM